MEKMLHISWININYNAKKKLNIFTFTIFELPEPGEDDARGPEITQSCKSFYSNLKVVLLQ